MFSIFSSVCVLRDQSASASFFLKVPRHRCCSLMRYLHVLHSCFFQVSMRQKDE